MAFFNDVGNFFNHDVKNFFSNIGAKISHPVDTITSIVHDVQSVAGEIVKPMEQRITGIANTLHGDAKDIINKYDRTINNVIGQGGNIAQTAIKTTGSTVSNVGSSFSWPLTIVGGALAVYLLMKK